MTRYVTVRLTKAQAEAACNAADLIADSHDADGDKRAASLYQRASDALTSLSMPAKKGPGRPPRAGKKLSTGRVELRLTEQEHARWLREADRREVSMAEMIRVAVEAYFEK